eukprot:Gb_34658 [translate_table: standard]
MPKTFKHLSPHLNIAAFLCNVFKPCPTNAPKAQQYGTLKNISDCCNLCGCIINSKTTWPP